MHHIDRRPDILILFEGDGITFSAESEAADRWIRVAFPGKLDLKYAKIKRFAQATFRMQDEKGARDFQHAAKSQGFVFC
jgi:hypothetical protein